MLERRRLIRILIVIASAICLIQLLTVSDIHASTITVVNDTDVINGDTSSPENLIRNPGPDGISLPEAIIAANSVNGPHMIQFDPSLKGKTLSFLNGVPEITGSGITINGDIDGDGIPDITLDGAQCSSQTGFRLRGSDVTIQSFNIKNFSWTGIEVVATDDNGPQTIENIALRGNNISGASIGISVFNWGQSCIIKNVEIAQNSLINSGLFGISISGSSKPLTSNNQIIDVTLTQNTITNTQSSGENVLVFISGAMSEGTLNSSISGVVISKNTMDNGLLLLSAGNSVGSKNNKFEDILISENVIESPTVSVEVVGGAQSRGSTSLPQGPAIDVSGNTVKNLNFVRNTFQKGGIQLVGAYSNQDNQGLAPTRPALQNSIEDVVMELNQISDCGANGVNIIGGSNGAQNNTVKNVTIRNNLIVKNQGAGISLLGGYVRSPNNIINNVIILNNTIAESGNSAWAGGININDNNNSHGNSVSGVTITNTILWGNMRGDSIRGPIAPDLVQFSIIGDSRYRHHNGNLYLSPEFVDPQNMNYRLKRGSPAIDSGNPNTVGAGETDLDGGNRIIDGNQDGVAVIDIGAYEYVPTSITSETISTPNTPSGPTSGATGTTYTYSTGGSSSNLGHTLEYQFDWKGNGSDLSPWGSATQSKAWTTAGVYNVRARARCTQDISIVSNWSDALSVSIISLPDISVTPQAYDFRNVKVKKSKTASFKVKNSGKGDLLILTSTITGKDASMFTITAGSGSKAIKPGKSFTIKVAFKPTSAGPRSANNHE